MAGPSGAGSRQGVLSTPERPQRGRRKAEGVSDEQNTLNKGLEDEEPLGMSRERSVVDVGAWGESGASELNPWGWQPGAQSGWEERMLCNVSATHQVMLSLYQ